jgi:hypothetical protein
MVSLAFDIKCRADRAPSINEPPVLMHLGQATLWPAMRIIATGSTENSDAIS